MVSEANNYQTVSKFESLKKIIESIQERSSGKNKKQVSLKVLGFEDVQGFNKGFLSVTPNFEKSNDDFLYVELCPAEHNHLFSSYGMHIAIDSIVSILD